MGDKREARTPLVLAGVALVAAISLLGGPATYAFWNDKTDMPGQAIDSPAGISLIANVTSAPFTVGALGSTVATSTAGLIPGLRGQRLTYTLTAGQANGVQGYIHGTIASAAKAQWTAVYTAGYLTTAASATGPCAVAATPAVAGSVLTWAVTTAAGQTMKAGQVCTIVLDLSIPGVKGSVDVSQALIASRGTAAAPLNPLADLVVSGTLTQVPRAEEK